MEIKQVQPAGIRAASISLTVSVIGLWILIPTIVLVCGALFLASILFNDNGHMPQAVGSFIGGTLVFEVGLVVLLRYSMRTRHDLAHMLPRARTAMLVLGAIYTVIALGLLFFPFPDPLAVIPGGLGVGWLIYFSRTTAFENPPPAPEILPPTI